MQWQKRRLRQSTQWRKQRRMIMQLFLVSGINVSLNLPTSIIDIAQQLGLSSEDGNQAGLYFFFLGYWVFFIDVIIPLRRVLRVKRHNTLQSIQ